MSLNYEKSDKFILQKLNIFSVILDLIMNFKITKFNKL